MAIEKVKEHFRQYGIDDKIMEFDVSSATVELAAKALNCEPERIAKTLSFKVGNQSTLIVTAGDAIELTLPEMEQYVNYKEWVDVCKNWSME